ncbi:DUF4175 domain-containing protein [Paracoccus sp. Z118]|uniref:DUF4175 domain-containing protein n=1 Tax=Paracoccus sp. Z118 TaxID=2851017 RepID=UPI001C2C8916|nr:DUF4175 family protein [Paracoccus sp. Z118]MBV0892035.1 DUF4175 domain-containing protein [Paracoccus sp. Z118]
MALDRHTPGPEPRAARRAVWLTLAGLWWEAVLRVFWPALSLLALGLAALALGLVAALPGSWALAAAVPWGAALVVAAAWGLMRFRRPSRAAALARVDETLPGAPLSALHDRMALGERDPGAQALWRAHLARMQRAAQNARPVLPDAGLRRRDPFGLRLMALTGVAMAVLFGGAAQMGGGLAALASGSRPLPGAATPAPTGPSWEGWAAPPAYTRRPTIYLNAVPEGEGVELPEGTVLSFRLYGSGASVTQDIGPAEDAPADAPRFAAERDGTVTVAGRELPVRVQPDDAPQVATGRVPERRADGQLVQDFSAIDDNGVERGQAIISLDLGTVDRRFGLETAPEPREPVALDLALPGAGQRRDVRGRLSADLARHPWANLPVTVVFHVSDGIGQTGETAPQRMDLPGRRFFDPAAAALIELRRDLLWSRENAPRTAQLLRAISWQPEGAAPDLSHEALTGIRAAIGTLESGPLSAEARDDLADALWQLAVQIEDGGLDDALARMKQAQERLSEAIRNGASPDEIQKLMDELKAATDAYTDMLAERGEDPADRFDRSPRDGRTITGDQIQEMMDEIQRLMNEGRMAEAQELLEQFNRMMENLQVSRSQGGEGDGQSRPMQRLNDTLQQQQDLADDAMRQAQDNPFGMPSPPQGQPGGDPQQGQGGPQGQGAPGQDGQPQPGGEGNEGGSLADRQRALREELGRQRGLLPGRGTPEGEAAGERLDEAGRAMERAEEALRGGDPAGSLNSQADAIEALREGMRALSDLGRSQSGEQGAQQQGADGQTPAAEGSARQGGGDGTSRPGLPPTDPLGRDMGGQGGTITTGDPLAEGGDPNQRARDLQDEIRRRTGEADRPREERDYLGRLLDRF